MKTILLPNGQQQQLRQVCRDYWIPAGPCVKHRDTDDLPSLGKSVVDKVHLVEKTKNHWYNRLISYFSAG